MIKSYFDNEDEIVNENLKPYALVLSADARYFNYQLIQLENFFNTFNSKVIDVYIVHGKNITLEHIHLLEKLFPQVKQIYLEKIKFLDKISNKFKNVVYGECILAKFLPIYLSKFYKITVFTDTDVIFLEDFFENLKTILEKADFSAMLLYPDKADNTWIRQVVGFAESSGNFLDEEINELQKLPYPMAGIGVLSNSFGNKVSLSEVSSLICNLFDKIYEKDVNSITSKIFNFDEFVYLYLQFKLKLTYANLPSNLHACIEDFMPYASRFVSPYQKVYSVHTPGPKKFWNDYLLLDCFPQYLDFVNIIKNKVSNLDFTDFSIVNNLIKTCDNIIHIYNSTSVFNKFKQIGLLYLYQEIVPSLIESLSSSKYFTIEQTLSNDRIILWAKNIPKYFRIDITPALCVRKTPEGIGLERQVQYYLPTKIFITLRYSFNGSNADNINLQKSLQAEFFKKLHVYFINSKLELKPLLLSLRIETDTGDFKRVFNKIENIFDKNQEMILQF